MAFVLSVFPDRVGVGSFGGPTHDVAIVKLPSGKEYRIARRDGAVRRYEFAFPEAGRSDFAEFRDFYLCMEGAKDSFPFRDPWDYTSSSTGMDDVDDEDQVIGTGDGTETDFQLSKTYSVKNPSGTTVKSVSRDVKLPKEGTVVCALDGVNTTAFTVNAETGVVTFTTTPGVGVVVTAGFQFYVECRFSEASSEWLQGAWNGAAGSVPSLGLEELVGEADYSTERDFGGAYYDASFDADVRLSMGSGALQQLDPTTSGLKVFLPNTAHVGEGIGHFTFLNESASDTYDLYPFEGGGSALTSVPVASGGDPGLVILGLVDTGSGKSWVAVTP